MPLCQKNPRLAPPLTFVSRQQYEGIKIFDTIRNFSYATYVVNRPRFDTKVSHAASLFFSVQHFFLCFPYRSTPDGTRKLIDI